MYHQKVKEGRPLPLAGPGAIVAAGGCSVTGADQAGSFVWAGRKCF
jgi:hypothetical protein